MLSFKSLIQTLVLFVCAAAVYFIDVSDLFPIVIIGSVIGTVLVLGYTVYYAKNYKKTLFVFMLGVMFCAMPSYAQQDALVLEKIDQIMEVSDSICGAPKTGSSYDEAVRDQAYMVLSIAEKIKQQQLPSRAKDVVDCAKRYIYFVSAIDSTKSNICPTMQDYIKQSAGDCWICGVGFLMIEGTQRLAGYSETFMRKLAFQLLAIMFLFWILVKVLMLFGTWGFANIGEFFSSFFVRFFVVAVVASILFFPMRDIFSVTISPFIKIAATVGIEIADNSLKSGGKTFVERLQEKTDGVDSDVVCPYCKQMNDSSYQIAREDLSYTPFFEDSAMNAVLCLTCKVFNQVTPFFSMGQMFTCYGYYKERSRSIYSLWLTEWPHMTMLLFGIIFIVVFGLFILLTSVGMIDAFFRLGLVVLFMPLFIVTYAFPISRHYTVKGVSLIVYSVLQLVGLSIAIGLLMNIFLGFIPNSDALIQAMVDSNVKKMLEQIVAGGAFYMVFVLIGLMVIGMQIILSSGAVMSELTGIQDPTGGTGASAAMSMAKGAYSTVKTGVKLGGAAVMIGGKKGMEMVKKFRDKATEKNLSAGDAATKTAQNLGSLPSQAGKASDLGKKGGQMAGQVAEKAGKAAADATKKAGDAAADAVDRAGQAGGDAMMRGGQGLMAKGAALSGTGIGAIIGVPLMLAGAAVTAAGAGVKVGAKVAAAGIKVASRVAAKAMEIGGKVAKKTAEKAGETVDKVREKADSIKDKVDNAKDKVGKVANKAKEVGKKSANFAERKMDQAMDKMDQTIANANEVKQSAGASQGGEESPEGNEDNSAPSSDGEQDE